VLHSLAIRDFVIVDALEIEFQGGFTVLSGETGAGKSILIDALALVLGARADASVVREGAARAEIVARFALTAATVSWLAAQAIDAEEEILLRRVIDSGGRSRAWINGLPATLAQLRELGALLVDIHGQHEHQSLLHSSAQRELLDASAHLGAELGELAGAFRQWQALATQRAALLRDREELDAKRERLEWQVSELTRLAVKPGEWAEVQLDHQRLSHAAALIEGAQAALQELSEADGALLERLSSLVQRVGHLAAIDAGLAPVLEVLEPGRIQLQEASYALKGYLDHLELDPERLATVEARVAALHDAARKFHVAPDDLAGLLEERSAALASIAGLTDLAALTEQELSAEAAYRGRAETLTRARRKAAAQIARGVTEGMQTLSMTGGRLEITIGTASPSAHGVDEVEFQVAAHANTSARPLAKVASGGELSRISLAIAVVTASASQIPTLIFDEVDVGIGGAVAEVVGRLLRRLGEQRQVLCVTHLPQVAAQAHAHFAVNKSARGNSVVSQINALDGNARVDELARMLGGVEITPTTRKHARELLATVA
jgi:DNA repair protein RecN (Recombination protein N)